MKKLIYIFFITLYCATSHAVNVDTLFKPTLSIEQGRTLIISWHIQKNHQLYQDKIVISPSNHPHLFEITLKKQPLWTDSKNEQILRLPIELLLKKPGNGFFNIQYQGCSTHGFCYPPQKKTIFINISNGLLIETASFEENTHPAFQYRNPLITLFIFLGLGLLLSLTPCVLPMIPVLSHIIIRQGQTISSPYGFWIAFSYVISMSFTYALIGAIIAKLGQNIQIFFQSPLILLSASCFFVYLALSLWAIVPPLQLPVVIRSAFAKKSYQFNHTPIINACLMGCLSTLILSPCVSAPLIAILSYIAQTGHILFGLTALFALSFGMGIPLLLVGATLGKYLPTIGPWMNHIKSLWGFFLFGFAIYLFMGLPFLNQSTDSNHQTVTTLYQLNEALSAAKKNHQAVVLDYYADWCKSCKQMESQLTKDQTLPELMKHVRLIRADLSRNPTEATHMMTPFNVIGPPTMLFITPEGIEIHRLSGAFSITVFKKMLHDLIDNVRVAS